MPTPFARLGHTSKAAGLNLGKLVRPLAKSLWNEGVWSTAAKGAERFVSRPGAVGTAARAFKPVAKTLAHPALQMAGLASIPAAFMGVPGADLAANILTPGWGMSTVAAPAIQSYRLSGGKYDKQIEQDARAGSDSAVDDLMAIHNGVPGATTGKGSYLDTLRSAGVGTDNISRYASGMNASTGPMSAWDTWRSALSDPQELVNRQVRDRLSGVVKSGSIGSMVGSAFRMAGRALPWLGVAGTAYGVGDALLSKKPYDAAQVQQEGYDATQAKINKSLEGMSGFERTALKWDPTLLYGKLDQLAPGATSRWEEKTGQKIQPGWLEGTRRAWTGGPATYFQYDNAGGRKYLPMS